MVVAWNFVGEERRIALCRVRVTSLDLMISCLAVLVPSVGWTHFNTLNGLCTKYPHASIQAVLEPKLAAVAKLVALKNPAELDGIRADRLSKVYVTAGFKAHLKP